MAATLTLNMLLPDDFFCFVCLFGLSSQAVCCSDLLHCCPQGHTCNLIAQTCDLEWRSVPWLEKEAAESSQREQEVRCDDIHTCSDGSTCCKTQTGSWGCCPLPRVNIVHRSLVSSLVDTRVTFQPNVQFSSTFCCCCCLESSSIIALSSTNL